MLILAQAKTAEFFQLCGKETIFLVMLSLDPLRQNCVPYCSVPDYMLQKVRMWFDYVWETQNMVDNREALDSLPDNLKAELRMDVNLNILKKITIFKVCNLQNIQTLISDLN